MHKIKNIFILILLAINGLFAQQGPLDSLTNLIEQKTLKDTSYVNVLNEIANHLRRQRKIDTAFLLCQRAIVLSDSLDYQNGKNEANFIKGILYYYQNEYPTAITYFKEVIPKFEQNKKYKRIGNSFEFLGLLHSRLGKLDSIVPYYDEALKAYEQDAYYDRHGAIHSNAANIFADQGNFPKALEYYQRSLDNLAPEDTFFRANTIMNIGTLYMDNLEYQKALDYLFQSKKMFESLDHQEKLALCDYNIGMMYVQTERYKEALDLFKSALDTAKKNKDQKHTAKFTYGVAYALQKLNRIDQAIQQLALAIDIQKKIQMNRDLAISYLDFAELHAIKGRYDEALKYNKLAQQIAIDNNQPVELNLAHRNLSYVYEALGNSSKAFSHLQTHKKLSDSLVNKENIRKTAALEAQYKFEKEKQRLESEQIQKELIYEQELAKQRWTIIGVLSISILVAIAALFAYRAYITKRNSNLKLSQKNSRIQELRKNEKKYSEEALASKQRELATMAMASHEKNALLENLEKKLNEVEEKISADIKSDFKEIKKSIADGYALDKSWDSFLHKFEDVHPNFFDKLKTEYNNLTVEDLKVCAYLKIGMSNKEIANVSHLTLGSVKSKINRLKKKLDMAPDDNLRDFILQFNKPAK